MTTKQILTGIGTQSKKLAIDAKKRVLSPTGKKYVKWRNIALIVAGVGGVILTAPVSLPAVVIAAAPYMVWLGNAAAGIVHVLE